MMEVFQIALPLREAFKSQTRRYASPRKFILLLASIAAAIVFLMCLCQTFNSSSTSLGVADNIYVISLRNRYRRREDMEKLRLSLDLHWTYVDGLDTDSPLVSQIMDWVKTLRTGPPHILNEGNTTRITSRSIPNSINFSWPGDIELFAKSRDKLDLWSIGVWPSPMAVLNPAPYLPIACATKDYSLPDNTTSLKEHLILTFPRIACWHSHLSVIRDIANTIPQVGFGVAIILEDDVDMERDIEKQLAYLWPSLPADWDIVFLGAFPVPWLKASSHFKSNTCYLGHCWSDEMANGSLLPQSSLGPTINKSSFNSRLYIAQKPKCTHAYALSRTGARRLLLHLRYPPFAYSRAIDQAISWLVESGRLKGFSIVPSLVIQRKVTESDVMPGKGMGSQWKDSLTNGVFADSQAQIV